MRDFSGHKPNPAIKMFAWLVERVLTQRYFSVEQGGFKPEAQHG